MCCLNVCSALQGNREGNQPGICFGMLSAGVCNLKYSSPLPGISCNEVRAATNPFEGGYVPRRTSAAPPRRNDLWRPPGECARVSQAWSLLPPALVPGALLPPHCCSRFGCNCICICVCSNCAPSLLPPLLLGGCCCCCRCGARVDGSGEMRGWWSVRVTCTGGETSGAADALPAVHQSEARRL